MLGQEEQVGQEQDVQLIHAIIGQVQDVWNAGSGQAFAAPFAEDADYVIVDGRRIKGRAVIAEGHERLFDTIYQGSINQFTVESVRLIRPDAGIAHVEHHLKFTQAGEAREGHARSIWVLTKENGEWRVVAFQNTPIAPPRA